MSANQLNSIQSLLTEKRWETARRSCLQLLEDPELNRFEGNACLFLLHTAYRKLGDFRAAHMALERITPLDHLEEFECAVRASEDFFALSTEAFYRDSAESRAGLTYEQYERKMRERVRDSLDRALALAKSPEEHRCLEDMLQRMGMDEKSSLPYSEALAASAKITTTSEVPLIGSVAGTIRFPNSNPAAYVRVILGLELKVGVPDPEEHLETSMGWPYPIESVRTLVTETDAEGSFRFSSVPVGVHEFLAVTLDPAVYDIPTRFLVHSVNVPKEGEARYDLTVTEWVSAPPREVASPFPEKCVRFGTVYRQVHQEVLKNPFYYDFPRQLVSFALPPKVDADTGGLLLLSSQSPDAPQEYQVGDGAVSFFTDLPRRSDRIFSLYYSEDLALGPISNSSLALLPEVGGVTAVIETGRASFRIAYGEGCLSVPPLLAVRGEDGMWRGEGRFHFPPGVNIVSHETKILEQGPLILSIQIKYHLSTGADYSWTVSAHQGEAYLLIKEVAPEIEGAAFEFSIREWSGGRGYLHWSPGGSRHWVDLLAEDRELARLQESVAWWVYPQGFGYAMTPPGFDQRDFVGVFTRKRGDWIDRKFADLAQGPGDANRELDWPYPEMVGSTVSMITAHTDVTGDAFFRFGLFDGARQWGVLVSTLDRNDGPWTELSSVQHKNSSPRLQDFKDWHLDKQDAQSRPFVVVHREQVRELRRKKTSPVLSPYWEGIRNGQAKNGPAAGILFLVDNDPAVAWQKKLEIYHAAQIRSKMVLLGRDFGDAYSPVGARVLTPWAENYDLLAASGVFSPEEEHTTRQFLMLMGHMHMEPDFMNWKFNSRNANFEADRVDVVGTIGVCFLGNPDAARFIAHGIESMKKSLKVYCTPGSGKWYENPACYYLQASKCRMNFVFHLYRHNLFDATKIPRLKDFLRWGILLLTPPCPPSYELMRDGVADDTYARVEKVRRIPPHR